jgi:hypothetical protein
VEKASKRIYFKSIEAIKAGFANYSTEIDYSKPAITDKATLKELLAKFKNKDKWCIIPETPKFQNGWADATIRIYLPNDRSVRTVRFASVMECFSKEDWAAIISHIMHQFRGSDTNFKIPSQFRNSYVLVGNARHSRRNVQGIIDEHMALPEHERYL